MKPAEFLAIVTPSALGFVLTPQLSNLIASVIIAVIVHFTSRGRRRRNSHRDDFDAN